MVILPLLPVSGKFASLIFYPPVLVWIMKKAHRRGAENTEKKRRKKILYSPPFRGTEVAKKAVYHTPPIEPFPKDMPPTTESLPVLSTTFSLM
jgi:hypothetical protein